MVRICSFLWCLFWAGAVAAMPEGRISVIDADTIDVGQTRVRLHGIDAPELGQPCSANGREWDCGRWARDFVRDQFEGQQARCEMIEIDRYGRVVATCQVGGQDMGAAIVQAGAAWAYRRYSNAYDLDEKAAAITEQGIWGVAIETPAVFRERRVSGRTAPDPSCAIKGNISGNGRIYNLPDDRSYARTGINLANGERWFCSTAEAEAAGWRPVRR